MEVRAAETARVTALALLAAAASAGVILVAHRTSPAVPVAGLFAAVAAVAAVTRPLVILYLAVALVPLELVELPLGAVGVTATEALFALAGIGWAVGRIAQGRAPVVRTRLNAPIALMLAAVVPGIAIAAETFPVVRILVMWTIFALAFQLVVDDGRPETVRRLLGLLAGAGAVVALVAVVRSGGRAPELDAATNVAVGRAVGAFSDPNILATFLALALPAALALAISGRPAQRPLMLGGFAVIVAGLALSLSRGGMLAAAGALVILLAWRPFRRAAAAVLILLVALTALNSNPLAGLQQVDTVLERLVSVQDAGGGVFDQRAEMYATTPTIIADHPLFGVGANQFSEVAPSYGIIDPATGFTFEHPHNVALTIAVELGVVGLAALLWAAAVLMALLWRACVRAPVDRAAAIAVAAAFGALAVQGLVDYTLRSNVIVAVTAVLAACAVVLAQSRPRATST